MNHQQDTDFPLRTTCTHCGLEFYVQTEPATKWLHGCVRPIARLTLAEHQAFHRIEGMRISRYLCGRCYHEALIPALAQPSRQQAEADAALAWAAFTEARDGQWDTVAARYADFQAAATVAAQAARAERQARRAARPRQDHRIGKRHAA